MPKAKSKKQPYFIPKPKIPGHEAGGLFTPSAREILEKYKEENVIFSWHFFDREHELFNCGETDVGWFITLMDTLKKVSQFKFVDFLQQSGKPLRVHGHDWEKLKVRYPLNDKYFEDIKRHAIQFSLSTGNGRVHGFHIYNVIYIVWLDPHHNLYPEDKPKPCDPPDDCYACLHNELEKLREENRQLYMEFTQVVEENYRLKNAAN